MPQWRYTSEDLNAAIRELEDNHPSIDPAGHEKPVAYMGWWWRDVDFDGYPYRFGKVDHTDPENEGHVGFMQNNKWGYPYVYLTVKQSEQLRGLLETLVDAPTNANAKAVYDLMQQAKEKDDG